MSIGKLDKFLPYKGIPIKCAFCIYEVPSMPQPWSLLGKVPNAEYIINTPKGERHVCASHALKGTWDKDKREKIAMALELTEEDKSKTMAFLVRKDGLFDLIYHPRGYVKFGLSEKEKAAYVSATPHYVVKEVQE